MSDEPVDEAAGEGRALQLGVDTGGTFTDIISQERDHAGRFCVQIHKVLSTPKNPSRAIADGLARVQQGKSEADRRRAHLIHGTTVATNALLERRGARVAFLSSAGFEDLLFLGRQARPELYNFEIKRPPPLLAREACFGVNERIGWGGEVLQALSDAEIARALAFLGADEPFEAVSVCFLHAYANPEHEARIGRAIRARFPRMHVSLSHEILPEFREFERASTTAVNAFVGPVMARYLGKLRARVEAQRVEILQSSGGRSELEYAAQFPAHTVLSGPAGGVVGARASALDLGVERIITFDMGGTSSDVSLCDGGVSLSGEADVGGLPVRVPAIDIQTVGAGGGSIAWADPGGALRVGPRSAGADPGPAAYGRGGAQPTVTDAHIYLGRVRPDYFLGGAMELDLAAARRAVDKLGEELGLSGPETARGILDITDANMMRAIKVISLERGHDPREFCLVAFGGAGGMHACRLAEKMEIPRVFIPQNPGVLSARGMLNAESQRLYSHTFLGPLKQFLADGAPELREVLRALAVQARGDLLGEDNPGERVSLAWSADLRYQAQSFELNIPVDWPALPADRARGAALTDPTEAFERLHQEVYGYRADGRAVELVALRLRAFIPAPKARRAKTRQESSEASCGAQRAEPIAWVAVDFGDGPRRCAHYQREQLGEGAELLGPAIVTEYSGTTVIEPGWRAQVRQGHLLMRRR